MSITFACACGKSVTVPDEFAGRSGRCKACGALMLVPFLSTGGGKPAPRVEAPSAPKLRAFGDPAPAVETGPIVAVAVDTSLIEPIRPSRRGFRLNPYVATGVGIPAAILIGFAVYLVLNARHEAQESRIRELKREGDALVESGSKNKDPNPLGGAEKTYQGYQKYSEAVAAGGRIDVSDSETRQAIVDANSKLEILRPFVQKFEEAKAASKKLQEERERQRQEYERAEAEKIEAERKLSRYVATIKGGAFIRLKANGSEVLRGLKVYLLPAKMTKKELSVILHQISERAEKNRVSTILKDRKTLDRIPESERLPLTGVFLGIAMSGGYQDLKSNSLQFRLLKDDALPVEFAEENCIKSTFADIDGKYKFENVKGGKYLIFALHISEVSAIEWCKEIDIDHDGEISLDLHNQNSVLIVNRFEPED